MNRSWKKLFSFAAIILVLCSLSMWCLNEASLSAMNASFPELQADSSVSEVEEKVNKWTSFISTIRNSITEIVALVSLIIGIPTAIGYGKKRHASEKSKIASKETIAEIVREMTQSEDSTVNPKVELIQQYIKAKAKDMSVDDLERALKLI